MFEKNGFVFHARGFGCVHSQELSTFGAQKVVHTG